MGLMCLVQHSMAIKKMAACVLAFASLKNSTCFTRQTLLYMLLAHSDHVALEFRIVDSNTLQLH